MQDRQTQVILSPNWPLGKLSETDSISSAHPRVSQGVGGIGRDEGEARVHLLPATSSIWVCASPSHGSLFPFLVSLQIFLFASSWVSSFTSEREGAVPQEKPSLYGSHKPLPSRLLLAGQLQNFAALLYLLMVERLLHLQREPFPHRGSTERQMKTCFSISLENSRTGKSTSQKGP